MNEQDWLTPEERQVHFDKYEALAQRIGVVALCELIPFTVEKVKAALNRQDLALNSLPLGRWDSQHPLIYRLAYDALVDGGWSLSDTVCLLKHVARYHYIY